jgi:hypothetical protein
MVFRRLRTPAERSAAARLLRSGLWAFRAPAAATTRPPAGEPEWSGLWSLTAEDGVALTAAAATVRVSQRMTELLAVAAPGSGLWMRLVRELANACRAQGVEWMVAGPGGSDAAAVDLLRRAGFDKAEDLGLPQTDSVVWLALPV